MAKKKKSKGYIRRKVVRTPDGLKVVWIDIATGNEVTDTKGWKIVSGSDAPEISSSDVSLDDELTDILGEDTTTPDVTPPPKKTKKSNNTPYPENNVVDEGLKGGKGGGEGLQGLFDAAQSIGLFSDGPGILGSLLGVKDNRPVNPTTGDRAPGNSWASEAWRSAGKSPVASTPTSTPPATTRDPTLDLEGFPIDSSVPTQAPSEPLKNNKVKTYDVDSNGNPILPTKAEDPFGTYVDNQDQTRLTSTDVGFTGGGMEENGLKGNTGNYKNYKAPNTELKSIVDSIKNSVLENGTNSGSRSVITQGVQPAGSVQMPPGARPSNIPDNTSELKLLNPNTSTVFPEEPRGNTGNAANYSPPNQNMSGIDPIKKSYLDLINIREGSPGYNQAFDYVPFTDFSKHPQIYNKTHDTSAAGKYQINYPTWVEYSAKVGVNDFSPESQDAVAWRIAEDNYRVKTGGGDLYEALKSDDPYTVATTFTKNKNRWVSLPSTTSAAMNLVEEFKASMAPKTAPTPMPYRPATGGTDGVPVFTPTNNAPTTEFTGAVKSAGGTASFAAKPSNNTTFSEGAVTTKVGGGVSDYNPSAAGFSSSPRQLPTHTGGALGGSTVGSSTASATKTSSGFSSKPTGGISAVSKLGAGASSTFGQRPTKPGEY